MLKLEIMKGKNSLLDIPILWNLTQFVFGCDKEKRRIYRSVFKNTGKLLDFGCADGNTFLAFTDFEYYGIDINTRLIKYAQKKYSSFKNAHFINADIFEKPFSPDFFDFILFGCTGHHLQDEAISKILNALIDVLKRGGKLYIFDTIKVPEKDSGILRFIINLDQGKFMKNEGEYLNILKSFSDRVNVVQMKTFPVKAFMPLPTFFYAELEKK